MPRYFFELEADAIGFDRDGVDLPDEAAAYAYAEGLAETLQRSHAPERPNAVVIRGEDGAAIARVPQAK